MKNNKIQSALKLNRLVFDKIEFQRLGFRNDQEIELNLESAISQKQDTNIYRVTLIARGMKPEEYSFEISLTGFFGIEENQELTATLKKELVSKNAVAILMPYLRSEISLLTSQPEVDCVILPVFNINKMLEE